MDPETKNKAIEELKAKGTKCGYCPMYIFTHNESGGKIFTLDSLPICVKCRIIKGHLGKKIKRDAKKAQKKKEKLEIEAENKRVVEFAIMTQKGMHKVKTIKNKLSL